MITTANKRTSAITKGPCNSAKLIFYIKVNNDSPHKLSFLWQWQSGSVNEVRCSASSMCNGTLHWKQLLWHKKLGYWHLKRLKIPSITFTAIQGYHQELVLCFNNFHCRPVAEKIAIMVLVFWWTLHKSAVQTGARYRQLPGHCSKDSKTVSGSDIIWQDPGCGCTTK